MKFKKTTQTKRGTYKYIFYDAEGKKQVVELCPGIDGVTESDIKRLHAMDDAEVYNNIKNSKVPAEDWQKEYMKDWVTRNPEKELPKTWNASLNDLISDSEGADDHEMGNFIADPKSIEQNESEVIERLHEVIESLTDIQRSTYKKLILDEMSKVNVATEENKSEAAVRKIMKKIEKIIADDDVLKKFFC